MVEHQLVIGIKWFMVDIRAYEIFRRQSRVEAGSYRQLSTEGVVCLMYYRNLAFLITIKSVEMLKLTI